MAVPSGLWRLYQDTPFPRIQVLAGQTCEERVESLSAFRDSDILVVAGGLGDLDSAIHLLSKTGIPCVFVLGPAELQGRDFSSAVAYARSLAEGTKVCVLDRDEAIIEGVRFLGMTLWSTYANWCSEFVVECSSAPSSLDGIQAAQWWSKTENQQTAATLCQIAGATKASLVANAMHPAVAYLEHRQSVEWLEGRLAVPFDGFTVVVSSNPPTRASLLDLVDYPGNVVDVLQLEDSEYRRKLIRLQAESNELCGLLYEHRGVIDLWVHGLCPANSDRVVEGVRVVCRSGRRARVDDNLPIGELLSRELAKPAQRKLSSTGKAQPFGEAERLLHPAPISLESGLTEPLSSVMEPTAEALQRHSEAIRALIPHTMAKSAVHRACVRRVIQEELTEFQRNSAIVASYEEVLLDSNRSRTQRLLSRNYARNCPHGYPTEMNDPAGYDYYSTADELDGRIDTVRDLPLKALLSVARWAEYAHVALVALEATGISGAVARPRYSAFRRFDASQYIDVVVSAPAADIGKVRERILAEHARPNELQPVLRLRSNEASADSTRVLLDRAAVRAVIESVEMPPVIGRVTQATRVPE